MLEVESMPVPGSKGKKVEKNDSRKKWEVNQLIEIAHKQKYRKISKESCTHWYKCKKKVHA